MMNFNEGVASRYGIREAVIAQHLWDLGEDAEFADAVYKDSKLWVRASSTDPHKKIIIVTFYPLYSCSKPHFPQQ